MNGYEKFYDLGYQVFEQVLNKDEIKEMKHQLEKSLDDQVHEFGKEQLKLIGEESTVRSPFLKNDIFVNLFDNSKVRKIVKDILGEHFVLSLQNGIMVSPNQVHHQSFYHRDIIHQDFTSSKPLGINLYYCLTDYTEQNGATVFIPRSHRFDRFPDHYEEICITAKSGDMILFDSMVYHKAGANVSSHPRYGINNMVTLPFIKQQIRYSSLVEDTDDLYLRRMFGFESLEHLGVRQFIDYRRRKINGK